MHLELVISNLIYSNGFCVGVRKPENFGQDAPPSNWLDRLISNRTIVGNRLIRRKRNINPAVSDRFLFPYLK